MFSHGALSTLDRYIPAAKSQFWVGLNDRYKKPLAQVTLSHTLPAHIICVAKSHSTGFRQLQSWVEKFNVTPSYVSYRFVAQQNSIVQHLVFLQAAAMKTQSSLGGYVGGLVGRGMIGR